MKTLQWGILGAGSIARAFATGVHHAKHGEMYAVASRSQEKADAFGEANNVPVRYDAYEALLADPKVDAVYIATPHPMHAEWAIRAAEAGKHILCEKPIALNAHDAESIVEAALRHDVFLMEAFMYRCAPQTQRIVELIQEGVVGEVRMIEAQFAFRAGDNPESRLISNALGGGGILDVGCYPMSMSRLIAGAALGTGIAEPLSVVGAGKLHDTSGVDEYAAATLEFPGGIIATVATGVRLNLDNVVRVFGTEGKLTIQTPWRAQGNEGGSSVIVIDPQGGERREEVIATEEYLYAGEADHVARNIERGQASYPGMTLDDTLGNMRALDQWREAIGLRYESEKDENLLTPASGRPLARGPDQRMKYGEVEGVGKRISRFVMGVDNQEDMRQASAIFDDFFTLGGNCFDTAHVYGRKENVLGQWIANRGVRDDVVVLTKGAHTPHCNPDDLHTQFMTSLERMQTDYVDIYMMHRDNLDVPVGEFVDVMHEHAEAGRMRVFGGSNWTLKRVDEANAYARANGKRGFGVLSNNFSLARMIDEVWRGSFQTADAESRAWLTERKIPIFSWSSQARGFFVPERAHPDQREDEQLVRCWYSDDNFERQRRAIELAEKKGCLPINIAAAYVLCQPFLTFCLIGPRLQRELWTSMPAMDVELTAEELAWLNLDD